MPKARRTQSSDTIRIPMRDLRKLLEEDARHARTEPRPPGPELGEAPEGSS